MLVHHRLFNFGKYGTLVTKTLIHNVWDQIQPFLFVPISSVVTNIVIFDLYFI